jgi:hypothetical protein
MEQGATWVFPKDESLLLPPDTAHKLLNVRLTQQQAEVHTRPQFAQQANGTQTRFPCARR